MNKVYSASDFVGAKSSILVEETKWAIDSISCTSVGEYSKIPLFEVGFRRCNAAEDANDATFELEPNRTYYVREGRPLFNTLAQLWEESEDMDVVDGYVYHKYDGKYFRGRVERLSGVRYTYRTKRGTIVQRTKMEVWYPSTVEEGVIMDDFIYLCNKGVYVPEIIPEQTDRIQEALKGLDPAVIAAIRAMK